MAGWGLWVANEARNRLLFLYKLLAPCKTNTRVNKYNIVRMDLIF